MITVNGYRGRLWEGEIDMQVLEKILEEIDEEIRSSIPFSNQRVDGLCRAKDIIRKHMNDGWIPVEEWLPEVTEEDIIPVEVTTMGGLRTVGCYFEYMNEWYALDGDSKLDVIAWKEPSEPYQPERSEGE